MAENRRTFVKKAGLGIVAVTLSPTVSFVAKAFGISEEDAEKLISFQCHLFRPKDLLDIEFSFIGAVPNKNTFSKTKYLKPNNNLNSYMIVRVAQQHISELFYYLTQDDPSTTANEYDNDFLIKAKNEVAKSFVSGYSFLVFKIHFDRIGNELRFSSNNLLHWNANYYELVTGEKVTAQVNVPNYPLVLKDNYHFQNDNNVPITTFELPYKLYLTPFPDKFIFSSNNLREKGNTVELWWNQIKSPQRKFGHPSFKVIGYEKNDTGKREDNSKEDYSTGEKYLPIEDDRALLTKQFLREDGHEAETLDFRITPLGAITKIRYNELDKNYQAGDIIEWKQDINLGRDNYVKVVTLGVIMPFGFKCKHIRIGERKIKDGVSFVEYKEFIEPLEFKKDFFLPENSNEPAKPQNIIDKGDKLNTRQLRNTPFKTIKITTKISPPIIPVDELTNEVVVDFLEDKDVKGNIRRSADNIKDDGTLILKKRRGAFWAKIKNEVKSGVSPVEELLNFNYVGIDWNNNEIHFKAPFVFARDILFDPKIDTLGNVIRDANGNIVPKYKAELDSIRAEYEKAENKIRREIDIAGQKIAFYKDEFIRDIGGKIESKLSELETQTIQFLAYQGEKFLNEFPYYPQLEAAYVYLPVVKEIIKDPRGTVIKYADVYLEKGIEQIKDAAGNAVNNVEGILLDIRKENIDPVTQKFKGYVEGEVNNIFNNVADKLAGVVKPEMVIKAVSLYENAYGTYQQCAEFVDTARNIKKITEAELQNFKNNIFKDAKLLGAIELKKLLADYLPFNKLPESTYKEIVNLLNEKEIVIQYKWISKDSDLFQNDPNIGGIVHFYNRIDRRNRNSAKTEIAVDYIQTLNLTKPENSLYSSITSLSSFGVGISLSGTDLITLNFNKITFTSGTNKKPDVSVEIKNVEFSGLLELVKQLQNSLGTFGKGLSFDIFGDKILVGYQFAVPAINSGAFNLSNIKLGFDFNLYFRNKPIDFWFRFSEREAPFLLSVGIFGGRGYFGIRVSSKQIEEIEALFEFGGYLGIDIGIARGCVFLFAGIFYRKVNNTTDLYGYIICGGILNVLGIIEMSMTFYLGMQSQGNTGSLIGTASVTVKIRVGFFKISRTASVTKRLTGGGGVSKSSDLFALGMTKTKNLLDTSEKYDTKVFDECGREISVPDDAMLCDSLGEHELLKEYSNAFN
ncbi:MAG: hypothetical protein ACOVOQ_12970 [Flavobacterium sp.]